MTEPKISLTLVLPGRTMVSQAVTENNFKDRKSTYKSIKTIPAKQVLKMSQEAYDFMLSTPSSSKYNKVVTMSKGKPIRVWDTMSVDARIRKYCETIAQSMGASEFSFNILGE